VIEINNGDTITIFNLNRPVKVRLLGVAAPMPDQPYADVAKKHLSDLVLDKFVSVEYSGLAENNYIVGKVVCRDMDITAQMLRDGVGWFDKSVKTQLDSGDAELYGASEAAARQERRGLWKDDSPISPWDFKRAQEARAKGVSTATAQPQRQRN
jgi:endonuclease YncB( thermonuclease family)